MVCGSLQFFGQIFFKMEVWQVVETLCNQCFAVLGGGVAASLQDQFLEEHAAVRDVDILVPLSNMVSTEVLMSAWGWHLQKQVFFPQRRIGCHLADLDVVTWAKSDCEVSIDIAGASEIPKSHEIVHMGYTIRVLTPESLMVQYMAMTSDTNPLVAKKGEAGMLRTAFMNPHTLNALSEQEFDFLPHTVRRCVKVRRRLDDLLRHTSKSCTDLNCRLIEMETSMRGLKDTLDTERLERENERLRKIDEEVHLKSKVDRLEKQLCDRSQKMVEMLQQENHKLRLQFADKSCSLNRSLQAEQAHKANVKELKHTNSDLVAECAQLKRRLAELESAHAKLKTKQSVKSDATLKQLNQLREQCRQEDNQVTQYKQMFFDSQKENHSLQMTITKSQADYETIIAGLRDEICLEKEKTKNKMEALTRRAVNYAKQAATARESVEVYRRRCEEYCTVIGLMQCTISKTKDYPLLDYTTLVCSKSWKELVQSMCVIDIDGQMLFFCNCPVKKQWWLAIPDADVGCKQGPVLVIDVQHCNPSVPYRCAVRVYVSNHRMPMLPLSDASVEFDSEPVTFSADMNRVEVVGSNTLFKYPCAYKPLAHFLNQIFCVVTPVHGDMKSLLSEYFSV